MKIVFKKSISNVYPMILSDNDFVKLSKVRNIEEERENDN